MKQDILLESGINELEMVNQRSAVIAKLLILIDKELSVGEAEETNIALGL